MTKKSWLVFVIIILLTVSGGIFLITNTTNATNITNTPIVSTPVVLSATVTQASTSATLSTTAGEIVVALNTKETPITANNFITLAKKGFYNGTIFHRVIRGFMIQGGDPTGTGRGGPGYKFADEPFTGEYTKGTVAMANSGPNTNGSQFFIMQADYALPKNYVIFGAVIKGLDVVDKIATAAVTMSDSGEDSKPVEPVKINSIAVDVQ